MGMKQYMTATERAKERWGEKMLDTESEDGKLKLQKDGEEKQVYKELY